MTNSTYNAEGRATADMLIFSNSLEPLVTAIIDDYNAAPGA